MQMTDFRVYDKKNIGANLRLIKILLLSILANCNLTKTYFKLFMGQESGRKYIILHFLITGN